MHHTAAAGAAHGAHSVAHVSVRGLSLPLGASMPLQARLRALMPSAPAQPFNHRQHSQRVHVSAPGREEAPQSGQHSSNGQHPAGSNGQQPAGSNGQQTADSSGQQQGPEVLLELQTMKQQMLQLLELLVAQQQQNVGLQSRVEELSQQVVSLKGNAADSETAQAADAVQAATAATVSLVQQIQVEGPAGSKAAADKTASSAEQSPPLPDARVADAPVAAQPQASTPLAAAQPPAAATADAPHSQRPASTTPGKALKPQNGQGKRDRQGKKDEKDKKDTKDRRDRQTQGRGRERGAVKVVPEDVRVLGRLEELRRQSDALVKALQGGAPAIQEAAAVPAPASTAPKATSQAHRKEAEAETQAGAPTIVSTGDTVVAALQAESAGPVTQPAPASSTQQSNDKAAALEEPAPTVAPSAAAPEAPATATEAPVAAAPEVPAAAEIEAPAATVSQAPAVASTVDALEAATAAATHTPATVTAQAEYIAPASEVPGTPAAGADQAGVSDAEREAAEALVATSALARAAAQQAVSEVQAQAQASGRPGTQLQRPKLPTPATSALDAPKQRPGAKAGAASAAKGGPAAQGSAAKASSSAAASSAAGVSSGAPQVSLLMRRIASARSWQSLRPLVDNPPPRLDAEAVAAALARLPQLLPSLDRDALPAMPSSAASDTAHPSSAVSVGVSKDVQGARALASELMALLQLQLPRLQGSALAAALAAAGRLQASPPRPSWVPSALTAVLARMQRMSTAEVVASLSGLAALGASPSSANAAALLSDTAARMDKGELDDLTMLGQVTAAVAVLLGPEDRPGDKWLASLQAAVGRARSALLAGSSQATTAAPAPAHGEAAVVDAAAAPTATPSAGPAEEQAVATEPTAPAAATEAAKQAPEAQQPKQQKQQSKQLREAMVPGAVSLIVGCHGLGAQLPQGWALDTLHTALAAAAATSATGAPSSTSPSPTPKEQGCSEPSSDTESQDSPARAAPYLPELATPLLQRCSGAQLAQLADALVAMGEAPSGQLQQAYAQAVWPKLYQLSPAQVQSVFQALVSWRLAFPTPLLCTFASRLATPEALASASLPTLASTLDTLSRLATHQQLGAEHTPSTGIAVTAASPSGLDASFYAAVDGMCDALMEKGLGQAAAAAAAAAVTAAKVNPQAAAAAARGDGDAAAAAPSAASRQLPPTALVAVLAALQRLGSTVRPPLAAAVMRDLRAALPTLTPELLRELALVASAGGAQVDVGLVEAFLEQQQEHHTGPSASPQGRVDTLVAVAALWQQGCRPRALLLGQLLASLKQDASQLSQPELVLLLRSMAEMRLNSEDTQGIRGSTRAAAPSPSDFTAALLTALQPHLQLPSFSTAASAQIAASLSSLGHVPPESWSNALVGSFVQRLGEAAPSDVVALLAALPVLRAAGPSAVPEAWVQACLGAVQAGVGGMDATEVAAVLEAVAGAASDQLPVSFLAALASRLQQLMDNSSAEGAALSPIAGAAAAGAAAAALSAAGVAPSPAWLASLQRASLPALQQPGGSGVSGTLLVKLATSTTRLACATSNTFPDSTLPEASAADPATPTPSALDGDVEGPRVASGLLSQQWLKALAATSANRSAATRREATLKLPDLASMAGFQAGSSRADAALSLQELASLLWALTVMGVDPPKQLIRSFVGGSQDRLSSLSASCCVEVVWALSRQGVAMSPKWLNQWAAQVQAHIPSLGPQSFAALVWSLGVQHPAGSAPPSTYLIEKLAQTLKHHLASQPSSSSAMASRATDAQTSAIPAAPQAPLCNRQVVALVTTLTRLGLPDHSEGLPRLICASLQADLASLPATDVVDALASLASCRQAPPSSWIRAATAALMALVPGGAGPAARQLPPAYAARCLWALAQLKHRPSEALVDACVAALAGTSTGDELMAVRADSQPLPPLAHDQLPLQHAVSALWALSVLWAQGVSSSEPAASSQAGTEVDGKGAITGMGEAAAAKATAWRWRRWQWLQEGLQERLVAGTKKGSAGGVATLDAPHLSCLLAALATPPPPPPSAFEQQQAQSATPQGEWLPALSPALASELGKAAAARFSSPSSPPAAVADAVWATARLGVSLPPAFAGSAQRRLQSCMAQLPGAQLARMLWSLAAAGISPNDPQLRAYSQRVDAALTDMSLSDLALALDAFARWNYRLPSTLLERIEQHSLAALMALASPQASDASSSGSDSDSNSAAEAGSSSVGGGVSSLPPAGGSLESPTPTTLLSLLGGLSSAGLTPGVAWLRAWAGLMNAQAVAVLGRDAALKLLELLAPRSMAGLVPSGRWVLAALSGLPPVSELDGAHVRRLARLAARWQAQLMRVQVQARQEEQEEGQRKQQAESSANVADSASDVSEASTPASTTASSPSPSPAVVAHVLQQLDALPRRVREKLPAFTASDCAAVLQDLALLHPRLCKLEADVHELLATQVLPGVQTLPLGERVSLIEALAPLAAESFAAPSSSRGSVSADPSAAALPSLYNALLVSLNGDELRLQTAGELVELTQALAAAWQARKAAPGGAASAKRESADTMRMQEVSRHLSDSFRTKLTAASGEELSRFMQAYCRLPRQQSSAQAASPAEPLLMAVMEVVSTRMERRTLTCAGLSHVAYGLARTGVIPSKPWVADLLRAAQANPDPQEAAREAQVLPDGPSASRLCYSLLVWGADAGQVAAGWLLQGVSAAMASGQLSASDAAIVFLGTSHLGVQGPLGVLGGGHVPRSWFDSFVDSALLPLLPSMDAPSLASTAAALPALGSSLGGDRRQQVLRQLEEVVGVALQRDEREANIGADAFPMDSLAQVAMAMFRAQHKPSPQWLQRAGSAAVREGNAGASALEWVQALAR